MPEYRAYRIKNTHIDGPPTVIACDSDQEAIEQAEQLMNGCEVELWEGPRIVRRYKLETSAGKL